MPPRIQYAKTEDGVSIAYWTLGEGEPIVMMPLIPTSRIDAEWELKPYRRWYERVASGRRLIRYDNRGSGLSERAVADFSIDAMIRDLEAVLAELELSRFALFGHSTAGPSANTYAVRQPERLSHLVLWETAADKSLLQEIPALGSVHSMIEGDWDTFTKTLANVMLGWRQSSAAHEWAQFTQAAVSQEVYRAFFDAEHDASSLLGDVTVQTLVVHERGSAHHIIQLAQELATSIRGAQLLVVDEGEDGFPSEEAFQAVGEFLGVEQAPPSSMNHSLAEGTATILFTDMESSTALTQSLGDEKVQELVRAHNAIVREALSAHDGTEIKHTGDGIMASFPTASSALACAIAIQRAVAARAAAQPEVPLALRIGLNAGESVVEEQDLFGASVQLAKRICDHAEPGQIVASNVVRELAMGKGFLFGDIGEVVPKGFEEPVRLYEVRWREEG